METLPHEKQIREHVKAIEHLKKQSQSPSLFSNEIRKLEDKLERMKKKVYSELTPWERVTICRHPHRPHAIDYIHNMCTNFQELCGDRCYSNDEAIIGGFAKIDGVRCMIIGQEKGNDTESRMHRNFGMMRPEGYRKALRLMRLAEKFNLPIVSMIDTKGADPTLEAEERGQGWAIAMNLREMMQIATPIIVVVIGEGCSGGALGIGVGDIIAMLEHSYYSVISPEGCASILWKDSAKKMEAAAALKMLPEDLLKLEVIDAIIKEPQGGAHYDSKAVYSNVKEFIVEQCRTLQQIPQDVLLEKRYLKFRQMGDFVIE